MNWHAYWATWASLALLGFAVPELCAVFSGHPERKLSQSFWIMEDAVGYPLIWRLTVGVVVAVVFYHLLWGPRH